MAFLKNTEGKVTLVKNTFECVCNSDEHQIIFRFFQDDCTDGLLYCSVHLSPNRSFFKRILHAVRYIFGYRSKFGDFDEVLLDVDKVKELKELLDSFERVQE